MSHSFRLLNSKTLAEFPSGSSLNYFNEKLYLIGDDANALIVLDKMYDTLESLPLFDFKEKRIPKAIKTDLESSAFITLADKEYFIIAGSASRKVREYLLIIPIVNAQPDITQRQSIDIGAFIDRLRTFGIEEVNLEGMTVMGEQLLLANRGNLIHPVNHLIITRTDFWLNQLQSTIQRLPIDYSALTNEVLSVSELCYEPSTDLLLITFASEATTNAYDDGAIGDSYVGYLKQASKKTQLPILKLDGMINLPQQDAEFVGEKIEGICIEAVTEKEMILHLVSDNDLGTSRLFHCALNL
ncbi:MAG TPA: hypothetical protein VIT44_06220, partial [Cyclobacteriaceae bacterium]